MPRATALCLLVLLLSLPAVALPAQAELTADADAPTLWYKSYDIAQLSNNLTAMPPNQTTPVEIMADVQSYARGREWGFQTAIPAAWTLQEDDAVRTSVVFEDLDKMIPLPDARFVEDGREADVSEGMVVYLELSGATNQPIAEGHTAISLEDLRTQQRHIVEIEANVRSTTDFGPVGNGAQTLFIVLGVMGRYPDRTLPAEDEPTMLTEGTDAASWIQLPHFPTSAFREWERLEAIEVACQSYDLQRLPCPARAGATPEGNETNEGPATGFTVLVAIGATAATMAGLFRRRH